LSLLLGAQEFDSVAKRIFGIEPPTARKRLVPGHHGAGFRQPPGDGVEPPNRNSKRRMGLGRRGERLLDSDVELLRTDAEPDTATRTKGRRLFYFQQAEQLTEEPPSVLFTPARPRDLDVVKTDDVHRSKLHEASRRPRRAAHGPTGPAQLIPEGARAQRVLSTAAGISETLLRA
jgi:hypothetical protein